MCWSRELSAGGRLDSAQVRHEADKLVALQRSIRERAFQSVYQPIVDLAVGTEIAWEALARPMDPAFTSIVDVLGTAERSGQVPVLGRVLREIQVAAITGLPADKLLFLNVHPFEFLEQGGIEGEPALQPWTKRIVLELTEAAEVSNFARARERVAALRAAGFRIAVDDLGSGYSSLNSLALLEPDFVKLDMAMIRGIEEGGRAARLIKHILEYCRGEGMRAVCEGSRRRRSFASSRPWACRWSRAFSWLVRGRPSQVRRWGLPRTPNAAPEVSRGSPAADMPRRAWRQFPPGPARASDRARWRTGCGSRPCTSSFRCDPAWRGPGSRRRTHRGRARPTQKERPAVP